MGINRSSVYYRASLNKDKEEKEAAKYHVIEVFNNSHKNYGTRRIKAELGEKSIVVSRRRIGIIMKEFGLKSTYTVKKYHPISKKGCNESSIGNTLNRCFDNRAENEVIVSDLTYVRVSDSWNYICTLVDLHNRGIIGWSVGAEKSAELVLWAFSNAKIDLKKVKIFHTDRGKEFCNEKLDQLLIENNITRSLSHKGTPYDNAVAEATYKAIKTEFVQNRDFGTTEKLKVLFSDYVHWFNYCRLHSSLGYMTPIEYKNNELLKKYV